MNKTDNPDAGKPSSFATWVDWLTIATWKFGKYTAAVSWLRSARPNGWNKSRWLQYDGFQCEQIFYGHALQSNEREHYIIKISGSMAGNMLRYMVSQPWIESFYCTRIDVERTRLPPKKWWNPRKLYDWLKEQGISSSVIESETGSTVYIGNRRSGRFIRLYEKELGEKYLRLEIELKSEHARMAFDYIKSGHSYEEVFAAHLKKSRLFESAIKDYMPDHEHDLDLRKHERDIEAEKQYKWLMTLVPKFQKMAASHEIGERCRAIFYSLSTEQGENQHE